MQPIDQIDEELFLFHHELDDLKKIWDMIKPAYTPSDLDSGLKDNFIGLAPVPYNLDAYAVFETDYHLKVKAHQQHSNTKLRFNAKDVIELIQGKEIQLHHRSCAGIPLHLRQYENNALCIHYKSDKNESVAIPGINYVPSERLIRYWKRAKKRDEEVIESFSLMNQEYQKFLKVYATKHRVKK